MASPGKVWDEILRKIDDGYGDEALNLCRELIRRRSPPGMEDEAASLIVDSMRRLGYDRVETDEAGNVVGMIGGGGGDNAPTVLFDGHMDTVSEGLLSNWRHHPYSAVVEDGVIHGRGASDMKGGLAAMVVACSLVKDHLTGKDNGVAVACVVHEEDCEGFGVRKVIEEYGRPGCVVLGEATGLTLAVGHRGRVELEIEVRGRTAHGSTPDRGVNAIYRMMPVIQRVKAEERIQFHPFLGSSSASVNRIWCSPDETPVVPDSCTVVVDRRTLPGETKQSILSDGSRYLGDIDGEVRVAKRKITCYTGYSEIVEQFFPAWTISPEDEFVKTTREYLGSALKREIPISKWLFSTDGAYTAGVEGIPTVGFGPGEERYAHTPEDQVRRRDVLEALKGYAALAIGLSKGRIG
ncbi:MAG: YgeY family selenium metabolism-linked hydrolase [Candidatus Bathyarchaeia archaeon]